MLARLTSIRATYQNVRNPQVHDSYDTQKLSVDLCFLKFSITHEDTLPSEAPHADQPLSGFCVYAGNSKGLHLWAILQGNGL
jgi:hypothetical protein